MKRTNHNYTEHLVLEAFKSTGYLIVNKTLINIFGLIGAVVLSNYIDKYQYFKNKKGTSHFDGWFFLRHKDIMKELCLKENAIINAKRKFIQIGFIEIVKKGIPAKEWITINFTLLARCVAYFSNTALDPQKIRGLDPQKIRGLFNNNKFNNNKGLNIILRPSDEVSDSPNKKIISIDKRNEDFLPLANYLCEIIQTKKNVSYNLNHIKKWSNEIRMLSEQNHIPPDRIKKALRWYKKNIGGQYIPVIESGSSLRNKFVMLESAKERSENPIQSNRPKNAYKNETESEYKF